MRKQLVTEPADLPVTLEEAKRQLRVDHVHDDGMILRYIGAATEHYERTRNLALITQTWRIFLDAFPSGDRIKFPRPPLQSVTHVKHYDDSDVATTFASSNYQVVTTEPGMLVLRDNASWPSATLRNLSGVEVEFIAGYGDTSGDVPDPIRQWLMIMVGDLYVHRESTLVGTVEKRLEFVDGLVAAYEAVGF